MAKIRFGFQIPTWGNRPWKELTEIIRAVEELGYDSIWTPDHLFLNETLTSAVKGDLRRPDMLDAYTILAAIAALTKKVRLGPAMTPIPLYNPSQLAKKVATLDVISDGRVELGLGCGWQEREFVSYGIEWNNFKTRMEKSKEGLELMIKLWTVDGNVNYEGKYYRICDAPFYPKPVQKPYPPLWFGGTSDSILKTCVEYDAVWSPWVLSPSKYAEYLERMRRFADQMGKRISNSQLAVHIIALTKEDSSEAKREMEETMLTLFQGTIDHERGVFGTADDCIRRLEAYTDLGITHFVLNGYPYQKDVVSYLKDFADAVFDHF